MSAAEIDCRPRDDKNPCAGARSVRCKKGRLEGEHGARAARKDNMLDIALKLVIKLACALVVIYFLVWKS
jgi:hypothetical protein